MLAEGKSIEAAATELKVSEELVRRDIHALRRAAAERDPWGEPAACNAAFIEAAENALQKVRTAQGEVKHDSTAYLNFVKLEWAMLLRFIELTSNGGRQGRLATKESEVLSDEDEPLRNYTNDELLQKARELGIDVTGFERALTAAAGHDAAEGNGQTGESGEGDGHTGEGGCEAGEGDEGIADPGDLGEAA